MTFLLLVDRQSERDTEREKRKKHTYTYRKKSVAILPLLPVLSGANRCFLMLSCSFRLFFFVRALSFIDMISTFSFLFPPLLHTFDVRAYVKGDEEEEEQEKNLESLFVL